MAPVLFMAAGGLLAGGALSVLRRRPRTAGTWVAGLGLLLLGGLCVANGLTRL